MSFSVGSSNIHFLVSVLNFFRSGGWQRLVQDTGAVFLLKGIGTLLGVGLHVLIARGFGPDTYGSYVFAMSWALLLASASDLGLSTAILRLHPKYTAADAYGLLQGFLRTGRRAVVLSAIVFSVIAAGTAILWPPASVSPPTLLAGIALTLPLATVNFETALLRSRGHMLAAYAPPNVLRPALTIAGAGGLFLFLPTTSPALLLGVMGIALAVTFIVQRVGNARVRSPHLSTVTPETDVQSWLSLSLPLLLSSGFLLVFSRTDVLLLGAVLPAKTVGVYAAALKAAQVLTLVGFAVDAVAGPAIARSYAEESRSHLQTLVRRLSLLYFVPSLGLAVALVVGAPWILSFLGPAYVEGQMELTVLVVGFLAHASTGAQSYLLTMTGHERTCMWIHGGGALVNLVLNAIGIYFWGTIGAAVATTVSIVVLNGWIHWVVVQRLRVVPSILALVYAPLASPSPESSSA